MVVYLKTNILLAIVFIILGESSSFEDSDIENICVNTLNPKFCFNILKSIPTTKQSDVVGMEKFLVEYVQRNVSTTVHLLQTIVNKISDPHFATDPHSKEIYDVSLSHFKWASTYCDNAIKAWANKQKEVLIDSLTSVARITEDDKYDLARVKPDPGPQILGRLDVIYDVCDTAIILADRLP